MWRQTLSVPIWSFGPIGTPAWQHLPESRDSVKELICEELQRAIDDDRDPVPVDQFEYVIHAVGPLVFDRLGVVDMDADLVRRFCLFCRDVLSYNGPDAMGVSYTFGMHLLEGLDFPGVVSAVRAADPGLVDLMRSHYPGSWADA
jgi:hypothetical protein